MGGDPFRGSCDLGEVLGTSQPLISMIVSFLCKHSSSL